VARSAAKPRVITALDFPAAAPALELAARLDPALTNLKIGKELFTRAGPQLVDSLQKQGYAIFLDLKYHDIPHTVAGACKAAADAGVWMLNVHASGGRRMLDAAREAVAGESLLIAVTVLTSMEDQDLRTTGVGCTVAEQVLRLATLARESGLDGVVCSARESAQLKQTQGQGFLRVTPGVRPEGSDKSDQRRVMTPAEALLAGSDYLVIGRPITRSEDPLLALQAINETLDNATKTPL